MGTSPPIVFIARHGARLDAADKNWHLTSPTPYDPPLSYGGWIQSRALGARIASLLRAQEFTGEDRSGPILGQSNRKSVPTSSAFCNRYNIIIHTSPYLRCLQTAIAISAGINQQRSDTDDTPESTSSTTSPAETTPDPRCLLRVDAFLGEWLSPDYFDHITPPPSSDRMVAAAKTELLRRGEVIMAAVDGSARASSGHFPGGWGSQSHPTSRLSEEENRRLRMRGASIPLPPQGQRQRASTYDTLRSPIQAVQDSLNPNLAPIPDSGYVPPTPGYAISASEPIPVGYVAHARDTCTKIDYQWDSMRAPQLWGTGGEYGEEWSTMQERVHDGFERMVQWYQTRQPSTMNRSQSQPNGVTHQVVDEREAETVLIVITHGADCNALIGSLSGHSLLLDIGTASLTMAVRRDRARWSADERQTRRTPDHSPDDGSVSQEYILRLVASTDHLRAGVNPSQLTSLSSPTAHQPPPPPPIPIYRNRLGPRPSLLQGHFDGKTVGSSNSSRGWTLASRPATVPTGATGLWGSISSPTTKTEDDGEEDDFVPDFGDPRPASQDSHRTGRTEQGWSQQLPQRTLSQRGLWSAPTLEERDSGMKRRWTVAEQKL